MRTKKYITYLEKCNRVSRRRKLLFCERNI